MNSLSEKKISDISIFIICGSSGFIGTNLIKKLQKEKENFITINRSHRKTNCFSLDFSSFLKNSFDLHSLEKKDLDWTSICEELKNLSDKISEKSFTCFHLSSYGVLQKNQDLYPLVEGNLVHTLKVLELCNTLKTKRIIQTGSCAEYAPSACDSGFLTESSLCAADSLYGVLKHASLSFARAYCQKNQLEWIGLRLFGVYGFGEHEDRLLPFIFKNILAQENSIPLTGGQQLRDFTYIDDLVDALYIASKTPLQNPTTLDFTATKELAPIFNVCSGIATSVKHMARLAAKSAGIAESRLDFGAVPYRKDESMQIVGNPSKFFNWTKWKASTPVEKGVKKFWEIYKDHKEKQ